MQHTILLLTSFERKILTFNLRLSLPKNEPFISKLKGETDSFLNDGCKKSAFIHLPDIESCSYRSGASLAVQLGEKK